MLSPEIIKKIKKIHIKSSRIVNSMMAGQYKSIFRGSGIEFDEVREYSPGDDIKSIDWKVSARLGKPFIKLYQEEREIVVMLLVDMSFSTRFGTTTDLKVEKAAEIASVLAFNAIKNNDKVGVILFTDRVEKYIPPKKGSSHIWRVIKEIFTFEPENKGTDINCAVSYLSKVIRKRSVTFIISDFLTSDYSKQLIITSKKHEIITILLSDPGSFRLPSYGIVTCEDLETGEIRYFDSANKKTRENYKQIQLGRYSQTIDVLKKANIDCIELKTDGSVIDSLTRYFRFREKRFR